MTLNKEDTHLYTCKYCKIEFKPTRRRVQKFCSNNCRSKNWFMEHSVDRSSPIAIEPNETAISLKGEKKKKKKPTKVEKISVAGVGNAAIGSLLGNKVAKLLTPEENKSVTQKDFQILKSELLGRYHPVKNADNDAFGRKPYYDVELQQIVYFL